MTRETPAERPATPSAWLALASGISLYVGTKLGAWMGILLVLVFLLGKLHGVDTIRRDAENRCD